MTEAAAAATASKKSSRDDVPPTPQPDAATSAAPAVAKAAPSPAQVAAKEYRETFLPLIEMLMAGDGTPDTRMKRHGAALMAAHMATELAPLKLDGAPNPDAAKANYKLAGQFAFGKAAAAQTADDVQKYGLAIRSRFPGIWGAANRCDVANFVRFLRVANLRGFPGDVDVSTMVVDYQGAVSKLGAI
jgi:hypothetical protein